VLTNLLRFVGLRQLAGRPLRALLTVLGVTIGVGLFVAIHAINASTLTFFRDNVTAMTGKASFTVFGGEAGFPEEKVDVVKAVPGVEAAVPMIESRVRLDAGPGHRGQTIVVLGIDLLQESAVRSYKTEGGADIIEDPLEFLNQEDSIIVTATFARDHGLELDSPVELLTVLGKKRFVVRGLLTDDGAAKAYGGGIAIMDIDGARVMFGREGKVDRIDIVPADGEDETALAARIQSAIGSGYRVEQKDSQSASLTRMVEGYQGILSFLSTLALLVGMCLVANTVTLAVAERRREIAILRALGATRTGILGQFIVEAGIMGLIGGILGVPLGRALGGLLVERVSQSMTRQYVTPIDVTTIQFSTNDAVVGVIAGAVAAILAALVPAWRATRVRGSEAFAATEPAVAPLTVRALLLRIGGIAMVAALALPLPLADVLKPLFAVAGTALAAPWLIELGLRGVVAVLSVNGPFAGAAVFRLAAENLTRNGQRTAKTALSLVVGLMLVVVAATIHKSFETSIDEWQTRTLRSDVIVSSMGRIASLQVQPLSETLAADLDKIPGVDVADGKGARAFRFVRHMHEGRQIAIKAIDLQHPRVGTHLFDVTDRPAAEATRELYAFSAPDQAPTVMVSQNFVTHFGQKTGDHIELDTPAGRTRFRVVGVVVDFANPDGVVYLDRVTYRRLWNDPLVTAFAVEAKAGTTPTALRDAIDGALGDRGLVAVVTGELRNQLREALDESFAYTKAIEAAALLVGLLGLAGTLIMSLMERLRELGMLRAIGMSRGQLVRLVLAEAALLGSVGGVVAAALGAYISYAWVVGVLASSLGWHIGVHIPWPSVATTMAAGLVVGLAAGLLSARRAATLEIRTALEQTS
jgi:putative ABC transport system permease protein